MLIFSCIFFSFNSQEKKKETRQKCTWPICKNETQTYLALSAIMCDDGNSTLKVCLLTTTKIGVLPIFLCILIILLDALFSWEFLITEERTYGCICFFSSQFWTKWSFIHFPITPQNQMKQSYLLKVCHNKSHVTYIMCAPHKQFNSKIRVYMAEEWASFNNNEETSE